MRYTIRYLEESAKNIGEKILGKYEESERATKVVKNILDRFGKRRKQLVEHYSDGNIIEGFPCSYQSETYSCGAQCVYMILKYYRKARSFSKVIKAVNTTKEYGTSQHSMIRLLRKNKLSVGVRENTTIKELEKSIDLGAPIIVSVRNGDHWMVVYGYSKKYIYVCDPARVWITKIRRLIFRNQWDRWMMIVKKK